MEMDLEIRFRCRPSVNCVVGPDYSTYYGLREESTDLIKKTKQKQNKKQLTSSSAPYLHVARHPPHVDHPSTQE